jgi:hypothetical protein
MGTEGPAIHAGQVITGGRTLTPGGVARSGAGDLTADLLASDWWTDDLVAAAGIPVVDVPFVSVGGGIGSFVTVDQLRIARRGPAAHGVPGGLCHL